MNSNNEELSKALHSIVSAIIKQVVIAVADQTTSRAECNTSDTSSDVLLTTEQVCKMLSIDKSSLWRWNKRGYLKSIRIGGLNRYYKSDIDRILNSAR
jgi:excisionase family DNA binding protein